VLTTAAAHGDPALRVFVYARHDREVHGSIVLAHGLHPLGPEDARLDRFLRILAHAGFLVAAPAMPDYLKLRCDGHAARDFAHGFDALRSLPECPSTRSAVVSISYGSYPALRLLTDRSRTERISGGVVFGGYGDPHHTLSYTLGVVPSGVPQPDLLSMPAVAINLIPELGLSPELTEPVEARWLELARRSWGKPELKERARYEPLVEQLASELAGEPRRLFLRGTGLTHDARDYFLDALARNQRLPTIDPRPQLASLTRPLHLMHGRGDDVIPYTELEVIAAACPAHAEVTKSLTGLYAHTGTASLASQLRNVPKLARELLTFVQMLGALTQVASGG
jgi:pimeloyl-ACP methyl ester carboxylesterase